MHPGNPPSDRNDRNDQHARNTKDDEWVAENWNTTTEHTEDAEEDDVWLDDDDEGDDDDEEDDALMDDMDDWNALEELEELDDLRDLDASEHPAPSVTSASSVVNSSAPPPRLPRDPLAILCALDDADARSGGAFAHAKHSGVPGHPGAHGTPLIPRPHGSFDALQALVRAPRPPWAGDTGHTIPPTRPRSAGSANVAGDGEHADGDTSGELTAARLDAVCHTLASAATNVGLLAFALARPDMLPGSGWSARHGVTDAHPRLHAAFGLIQALFDFEDAVALVLRTLGLDNEDNELPPHPRTPRHRATTPRDEHNDISGNSRQGGPA